MTVELAGQLITCGVCGETQRLPLPIRRHHRAVCRQCATVLTKSIEDSQHKTLAFSFTALLLLIPANFLPFLTLDYFGQENSSTIWQGVVSLASGGSWFVAVVVLVASIVLPIAKVAILFLLCFSRRCGVPPTTGTKLFNFIEAVGRWSMLDIFILAVIVSLIKFGTFADAAVEPGALAFLGVVIFTMLASQSFEPRMLWERK